MKILLLRFSSIGDIVLTSPVLRCLKQQVPDAEVHVATKSAFADLLRFNPHVSKVHELGDDLGELIRQLKAERFDRVIDLHHNLRTARIKRALGVPARSFNKLNVEKWLLVNLRIDRMPRVHIVDRYLDTVADLGVKNDGRGLELFIPPDREVAPEALPEPHRTGYTALAIGAAHATKRLPPHKLIALAKAIEGPIVLIGSAQDNPVARAIGDAIGARVYDATGRYDLLGSASLIRRARTVITHDSGAMHIACALGRPVVSVWGSTVPAFGMGPYQPVHPQQTHVVEVPGLGCRPCSKLGFGHCPKGHFHCMEKQDIGRIAQLAAS
ncbi:MAG TPA: glycosyltransferase family 9 protein [Flavobacteriales bacterium]|nr:glycosyltransferase family 9 protein [Flavobacteriales bacterium]HMR29088.1 glycosyltransferase family 9 protein [Flavobacteriales bacterium]